MVYSPWRQRVYKLGIGFVQAALAPAEIPQPTVRVICNVLRVWERGEHSTHDEWEAVAEGVHVNMTTSPILRNHYKRAVHRLWHIIEAGRVFCVPVYAFLGQVQERMNQVMGRALGVERGDLVRALSRVRAHFDLRRTGEIDEDGRPAVPCPTYA